MKKINNLKPRHKYQSRFYAWGIDFAMWNVIPVTGTVVSTQKKKIGTVVIMLTSKSYFGFHPESSMILQCKSVTLKCLTNYSQKKKKKKFKKFTGPHQKQD